MCIHTYRVSIYSVHRPYGGLGAGTLCAVDGYAHAYVAASRGRLDRDPTMGFDGSRAARRGCGHDEDARHLKVKRPGGRRAQAETNEVELEEREEERSSS